MPQNIIDAEDDAYILATSFITLASIPHIDDIFSGVKSSRCDFKSSKSVVLSFMNFLSI